MMAELSRKGRARASIVAALIALVAIPLGMAGPVAAAQDPSSPQVQKYVALGDSIAAGQGAGGYVDACLRSPAGYPGLLDAVPKVSLLRNAACTGATIASVTTDQLSQVNRGTTLVTVTIGVNGVNLPGLYAACASGQTPVACAAAVNTAVAYLTSPELAAQLRGLIADIDGRSPNATIVLTGYAVPFLPGLSPLTDSVNQLVELLNTQLMVAVIASVDADTDVRWAPVEFGAHRVGGPAPWLGANPADPATFLHPTAEGYVVYRDAILAALQ